VAVAEVVGTAVYAFGARDGIAVAAVTSSQFGAIAAVVSVLAFGERLRRIQVAGVVLIAAGVGLLAALQAT
jgi:drug/metabolite transporter (DMT)-like permease